MTWLELNKQHVYKNNWAKQPNQVKEDALKPWCDTWADVTQDDIASNMDDEFNRLILGTEYKECA